MALSKRQRQIIALMKEHGAAAFPGGTRKFYHFVSEFGLVIKAYQMPEYFLKHRGLIEAAESNAPGHWYRLTPEGERVASALRNRQQ